MPHNHIILEVRFLYCLHIYRLVFTVYSPKTVEASALNLRCGSEKNNASGEFRNPLMNSCEKILTEIFIMSPKFLKYFHPVTRFIQFPHKFFIMTYLFNHLA